MSGLNQGGCFRWCDAGPVEFDRVGEYGKGAQGQERDIRGGRELAKIRSRIAVRFLDRSRCPALEKPANGTMQMQILVSDVAANGNCPARKIPTIALIYTPNKDFVGTDSVQIEVEVGNRTTYLSYRLAVLPAAQPL